MRSTQYDLSLSFTAAFPAPVGKRKLHSACHVFSHRNLPRHGHADQALPCKLFSTRQPIMSCYIELPSNKKLLPQKVTEGYPVRRFRLAVGSA